jgi:glycine/D-amino acid oxidase-like deaminating enzyme
MEQFGIAGEWLDGTDLVKLEKNLAPDLMGGVFFPDDACVDARKATSAMIQNAARAGLNLYRNYEVTEVEESPGGGSWQVRTRNATFESGIVVCAAGVWSSSICAGVGISLPTRPRKGHILVTERLPGLIAHPMLEGDYTTTVHSEAQDIEVAFVAEMAAEGTILLGSSRQFVGFDRSVSPSVIQEIAARAIRFIPKLKEALCIRSFAGLRPWSPDHLPLIGPYATVSDFYVATGHEGAGIGLAPVTGKMISEWISGVERTSLMTQVSPARFIQ